VIVTISNQYGAGGWSVARRAAETLGYEFVERQLPVVVAQRLHIPVDQAEEDEMTYRTAGEQFLTGLELATPELAELSSTPDFDETMLQAVQEAVREFASRGNVVIAGRGASAILGRRPGVLRVYLYAPRDRRVRFIAEHFGVDAKTAEKEVDRVDKARAAYMREWYGITFGDPSNYDLCIDTSALGEEQSAATIVDAVRKRG
jgi:cytidylate kinase